jgi:hypothetical protein
MQTTRGWTGPHLAALTVAIGLAVAPAASASPTTLMTYATSGTIDTATGVSGPDDVVAINFRSVEEGSYNAPSSFSLGEFVVAALPPGVVTTYTNTPFKITYFASAVNGEEPTPNETPVTFTGVLNGTVSGPNQSDVVATFDPLNTTAVFRTGDFVNTLSLLDPAVSLVPSTTNGGRTTAQARLVTEFDPMAPIPEPATLTLFIAAIAGIGLRRRLRSRVA